MFNGPIVSTLNLSCSFQLLFCFDKGSDQNNNGCQVSSLARVSFCYSFNENNNRFFICYNFNEIARQDYSLA